MYGILPRHKEYLNPGSAGAILDIYCHPAYCIAHQHLVKDLLNDTCIVRPGLADLGQLPALQQLPGNDRHALFHALPHRLRQIFLRPDLHINLLYQRRFTGTGSRRQAKPAADAHCQHTQHTGQAQLQPPCHQNVPPTLK